MPPQQTSLMCFRFRENTSRNHLCHGSRATNSREKSKPCQLQRDTPKFKVGDQVFGAALGTFATQVLVDEVALRTKPAGWTYAQASGLFYTAPTAYAALILRA